jgi:hypothetical protein
MLRKTPYRTEGGLKVALRTQQKNSNPSSFNATNLIGSLQDDGENLKSREEAGPSELGMTIKFKNKFRSEFKR